MKEIKHKYGRIKRPMLFVAVCSISVSVALHYFFPIIILIAVITAVQFVVFLVFRQNVSGIVICVLVLLFCVSTFNSNNVIKRFQQSAGDTVSVTLVMTQNSERYKGCSNVTAKVVSDELPKNYKINLLYYSGPFLRSGDIINADISVFESRIDLGSVSRDIYASARLISVNERLGTNGFYAFIQDVRDFVTDTLFSNTDYNSAATLNAVLTGDRSYMSDGFADSVKETGVSHIMVVSGLHLAIIIGAFFGDLDKLFYNKYLRFVLAVILVLFMAAVCGFTVSIIRAGIMFVISAAAPIFKRDSDSLSSLSAAVYIILFLNPFAVFSISLQLSTLATFGLIVPARFFDERIKALIKNRILTKTLLPIAEIIINTLCATFMTLPVLIYSFGYVSVVAVITNLLITYAVTGALIFTVIALTFNVVGLNLPPFFCFASLCARYINYTITAVSEFPYTTVDLKQPFLRYVLTFIAVGGIVIMLLSIYACNTRNYLLRLKKSQCDKPIKKRR